MPIATVAAATDRARAYTGEGLSVPIACIVGSWDHPTTSTEEAQLEAGSPRRSRG
jgi:hypothetical protein